MPVQWKAVRTYTDIRHEVAEGIAKITINRPEERNAFRPQTLFEISDAFAAARDDASVGVIIFTGEGTEAFCSGGDQRVRGHAGYVGAAGGANTADPSAYTFNVALDGADKFTAIKSTHTPGLGGFEKTAFRSPCLGWH